jgi:hypothetical protein
VRLRPRLVAGLVAVTLSSAACTITLGIPEATPTQPSRAIPRQVPTGPGSAAAAMRALCVPPRLGDAEPVTPTETPPAIAEVQQEVETVRELTYERPVAARAATQEQIDAKLTQAFDDAYPAEFYDRRTRAWRTLGVIGPEADIRTALLTFQTGQVVGFYDPQTGELVYAGDTQLDLTERFTLAHELTHAIDDQRFDLSRLDAIAARCQDDRFQAALGAVEGSAQYFATQVITRFPAGDIGGSGPPSLEGIPPFMVAMQLWPYTAGQAFMTARASGGVPAIDEALRTPPASTEQVLHPDAYPNDVPQPVDIPDLAPRLGPEWTDLDVMVVGEAFLREMLRLRLDAGTADAAAAGWGGGTYRAWTDDTHTALVLATIWDTPGDAEAFAQAARDWLAAGDTSGEVLGPQGSTVRLIFSDDPAALSALRGP